MKADRPKSPTKLYTIAQIAECVEASTRTVRRWIEKKLLVAHRINGLVPSENVIHRDLQREAELLHHQVRCLPACNCS